jgi:hypothetical protein
MITQLVCLRIAINVPAATRLKPQVARCKEKGEKARGYRVSPVLRLQ